ncbi:MULTISPECIES: prepilin-type N-terminal cleavage/methylation domain-containing protein [Bradyrhizobium]|uniref:prepilin-type N-terminal cleavage/methylation domain-containing protein n=1 Tax=Bradyrhizobium TaxID=374 RepID=UPI000D64CB69|nr:MULTISPECIES: prepilin-type N-terminal cleavage/methylation domain-containing protein [Bradyrhizobium]MCA1414404.1 prepilin-type N-terminal cleavage/methylation domain-containing protein [Bradyrhizobium sp. NBAIM20]MCA1465660.1 prepilin-type N-terminal cleavage/methylation domain-containing protein [Bradyrhizobium sp. NBAIM18]MCA1530405.1 prepilin-type N-terminal cleavage/methylation domain-containing protein [Bradyrhizobium yuanmingense]PWE75449.1 general secretion pathway protein GspH [Bra
MNDGQRGFTLLEVVCMLAITGMIAAVLLPFVPRQTSKARLQAYALAAASILKADRAMSVGGGVRVDTLVDPPRRAIHSGASSAAVQVPDDVKFEAILPRSCNQRPVLSAISFFPDGLSCGGAIALWRADLRVEIRINWLTGRIEVVSRSLIKG